MTEPTPPSLAPNASPRPVPPPARRRFLLGRLARAVRRQDWFTVLVEVAVVVLGVVIGFQVTAWGQSRADRAKEQVYLGQLADDLRETLAATEQAAEDQRAVYRSAAAALRAYRSPDVPPLDSLRGWIRGSYNFHAPTPVLGTAQGIIASGDLSLLRNDSLRAALPSYVERSRERRDAIQVSVDLYAESFGRLIREMDIMDVALRAFPPSSVDSLALADATFPFPAGNRRTPFPTTSRDLLADTEIYSALVTAYTMNGALLGYQSGAIEAATDMLRLVETAQGHGRALAPSDSSTAPRR